MKLFFLSGLPRSGSTLLTALLYQNPAIHSEGVSGLCDLMWSAKQSLDRNSQWNGNRRQTAHVLATLPSIYYSDVTRPVIIDKCRTWTLQANVQMLQQFMQPKIVCCVRDVDAVVDSFRRLFSANGRDDFESSPFASELQIAQIGMQHAFDDWNDDTYLLVDYDDLINNTHRELQRVYAFLGLDQFEHDLHNITNQHAEDDSVYGLIGMHDVRSTISRH